MSDIGKDYRVSYPLDVRVYYKGGNIRFDVQHRRRIFQMLSVLKEYSSTRVVELLNVSDLYASSCYFHSILINNYFKYTT